MRKFFNVVLIIALAVICFYIGVKLSPLLNRKPVAETDTLIITVLEDTTKVNTLTRKLAHYLGLEQMYNDLLAKYQVLEPETVYHDTSTHKISLNLHFILRVDKVGRNLKVYTYKIENLLEEKMDFFNEGNSNTVITSIVSAVNRVLGEQITEGKFDLYSYDIPENANFYLYATTGKPKLINVRQMPFSLSLYGNMDYFFVPENRLFVQLGSAVDIKRVRVKLFYQPIDKIGIGVTYTWRLF